MASKKNTAQARIAQDANLFCSSRDLTNEASVESFFVLRLLQALGYEDGEIRTKEAIEQLKVPRGRQREAYRPDYLIVTKKKPRWIIDAKSPNERIEDFTHQCAGYSLLVNRKYPERPCRFYMLTNGLLTRVFVWDQEEPILSLRFSDFATRNPKYQTLLRVLGADAARAGWPEEGEAESVGESRRHHLGATVLARPRMDVVKRAFARCHQIIWKAEKMSPQASFLAFAKLLFVKLWEDRKLRDTPALYEAISKGEPLPNDKLRFSTAWIESQEANIPNPIDAILFKQLVERLEEEIQQRKRKRIFEPDVELGLSPGTVKRVVEQLESYYLFGIDEDLNGRMFEAFLVATMRGQALGQYFTPRSIVKLMTRMAMPAAVPGRVERVLDACCGTGGFLIEALTEMRRQVYENTSLTKAQRSRILDEVANEAIFGIDAGKDPPITRIARINMYLHGDGGSRVYRTDGLRKTPEPSGADSVEVREEVAELRELLDEGDVSFDVVLTNPPFSMDYSASVPDEEEVLRGYELCHQGGKRRSTLRSSVMFLERYHDLLRPGGRLFTVIDDSVLSGKKYDYVRDYLREKYVIRGVISLHGDAFQRAGARAKTSVLCLTKREDDEQQPDVFVYESLFIGRDDVVPRTRASDAELARSQAIAEIDEILDAYAAYQRGEQGPWLVPAARLDDRLDAKYLRPWTVSALEPTWAQAGATSARLGDIVDLVEEEAQISPDSHYDFLSILYAGQARRGERVLGREVGYPKVYRARADDLIVSNINAVHGAICVLPADLEDAVVSSEYTVLRVKPKAGVDPYYLWSVLRTAGVIAEWLSGARGVGRTRVGWDLLADQQVPLLQPKQQRGIGDLHRRALEMEAEIVELRQKAEQQIRGLELDGEVARDRLARAKPPK